MTKKQRQTQKIFEISERLFAKSEEELDDYFKARPFLEDHSIEPVIKEKHNDRAIEKGQIYRELMESLEKYGWNN